MGGGTSVGVGVGVGVRFFGLSPRGRGNPYPRNCRQVPLGSIPAWAGEPFFQIPEPAWPAVYPRVGGGTDFALV